MATERLSVRQIREILRLRHEGRTVRDIARSLGVSVGAVATTSSRAKTAGLTWTDVEQLDEAGLEHRLYGRGQEAGSARPRPDPVAIHRELRRPGVTLELLHLEFLQEHPTGLRYTAFCDTYRKWQARRGLVMRQVHKGGDKCFVDYSGKRPSYVEPSTGERVEVELFVAVLGASNFTFAEATLTQQLADFIQSHTKAYAYFGGVTVMTVPDQLKSAVTSSCRYEPGVNRSYAEMARHYGTTIVPARPYKPRDKAKVEVAVQVAQRWILARLRNETIFSLAELNHRIRALLEELNDRPMKKLGGATRRELRVRYDAPALRALPTEPYELSAWKEVRVNLDYHVEYERHWYSAPWWLVRESLWIRATAGTIELLHRGERVAGHARSYETFKHTTRPEHMPEAHRRHRDGVDGVLSWGASVGPMTEAMVRRLVDANPVKEQGWRSARGLQRVGEQYGAERTELACERALRLGGRSYKIVKSILACGREAMPLPGDEPADPAAIDHENLRGPEYYH